jgi:hypothetical protein
MTVVAKELALSALAVFAVAATLASLALVGVMARLTRDFDAVEAALRGRDGVRLSPAVQKGPFGRALRRFFETVRRAEADIAQLRSELDRGGTAVNAALDRPEQANARSEDRLRYAASEGHP